MQGCSGAFADKEMLFLEREKFKVQANFCRKLFSNRYILEENQESID
jgi:hypothetical protein